MRLLLVLLIVVCLSLIPFSSYARDIQRYTPEYNRYIATTMSGDIYNFVKTIKEVEDSWETRRHILLNIFKIIDDYNCSGKMYVVNRGLYFRLKDKNITEITILIFVMVSTGLLDKITINLDIEKVQSGEPMKELEIGRSQT